MHKICDTCGKEYFKYCSRCFVEVYCSNCGKEHIVTRNHYYTHAYFPCEDCKDIPYMMVQDDNPVFIYRRVV